jgi:hypothetical protein
LESNNRYKKIKGEIKMNINIRWVDKDNKALIRGFFLDVCMYEISIVKYEMCLFRNVQIKFGIKISEYLRNTKKKIIKEMKDFALEDLKKRLEYEMNK